MEEKILVLPIYHDRKQIIRARRHLRRLRPLLVLLTLDPCYLVRKFRTVLKPLWPTQALLNPSFPTVPTVMPRPRAQTDEARLQLSLPVTETVLLSALNVIIGRIGLKALLRTTDTLR